jgi:Arc/MetJ family transcription regulator
MVSTEGEGAEIRITEDDLAAVVSRRTNEVTSLQLQVAALSRAIGERDGRIAELEQQQASRNGKGEASHAEGGKKEVPVHGEGR